MIHNLKNKIRELSNKNRLARNIYSIANTVKVNSLSWVSDETFAKMKYKENRGLTLNLDNPKRFNEKLWWLKLNNRDPLLTICSDKYLVRDYVKDLGLEHILNDLYGVYERAEDIDFEELPDQAFIKTNHGSGTNILWNKENPFNKNKFIKNFNKSLKQNYYLQSREWNYKDIKPKIIVEKVLEDKDNSSLIDYKFMCFHGEVKLLFVDYETASKDGTHNPYATRNIYDKNFNYLDVKVGREHFDKFLISKPKKYKKMIEYAEKLSNPFPHCRVDLYNVNGQIFFGEITFYHGGGNQKIVPDEWDYKMGNWINIESSKIKLKSK